MEEQDHPATPSGRIAFLVEAGPSVAAGVGVLAGFVVARYVLGLQPAPWAYLLIGGVGGGLVRTFWVLTSPYAPIEVARYRSPRLATLGRAAQVVYLGCLWVCALDIYCGLLFSWSSVPPPLFGILFAGSGIVYFASLKRGWETAFVFAGALCAVVLIIVARQLGLLPRLQTLTGVFCALFMAGGLGLFIWARRRTRRKNSGMTEVSGEGSKAQEP